MAIYKIKPDYFIGILVLFIFIILTLYPWPLLEKLDSYLYRTGSYLASAEQQNSNEVFIVNIDRKRISKAPDESSPQYPDLTKLTERLTENGVKLITFSFPFRDNRSARPLREIRTLSEEIRAYPPGKGSPEFKEWVLRSVGEVETRIASGNLFKDSIKDGSRVIFPVSDTGAEPADLRPVDYLNISNISPSFLENISVKNMTFAYPELLKNAAGSGYVSGNDKSFGDDKSFPVYVGFKGRLVPVLALRMAAYYYGLRPIQVEAGESKIVLKDTDIPLIKGRMYVPVSDREPQIKNIGYEQLTGTEDKLSDLKDKIVIIGLRDSGDSAPDNGLNKTDADKIAVQFLDIIANRSISRPPAVIYLEIVAFILIIYLLISFTSKKGHLARSLSVVILVLLLTGITLLCFSMFGVWLKVANIIFGVILLFFFLSVMHHPKRAAGVKSHETGRILGLNLQSQGELDLAYEEFKTLPLDKETRDLIYNLGLEYEKKKKTAKALELYTYINRSGGFRDLDDRIPLLRESDYSSTMGSYGGKDDQSVLSDSSVNTRTMVGRYKIIGQLGKGSMGLVYKAQDPKINRPVAIKTIRFSDEFDEDVINEIKERFFMEAEIAGKLSHPAIVTIHDVGDDRDLTYMAMEYLEGEDLDKYIRKENLLPIRTVLDVVAQIAEALDFAHKEGVIHRDIKPANVMLLKNGQVKVTDFGIAKAISSSKTKTGVILGTPNYMSPEQIMGQKIDSRSDIFSLGVLFYQLLTGELPFHGDNLSGLLYQITQVKHSSPKNYNQKIPKICEQILDKALTKDPAKRFKTAGEMAYIIRTLCEKMDQLRAKKKEAE